MPDPHPIHHLLALGETVGTVAVPTDTAAWVTTCVRAYVERARAGDPVSLERIMGLGAPGRPNWVRAEERAARDAKLREIHRAEFPGLDEPEAARSIRAKYRHTLDLPRHRQLVNVLRKSSACM